MKTFTDEKTALAWAGCRKGNSTFFIASEATEENGTPVPSEHKPAGASAERHSFLQYAMLHFRDDSLRSEPSMSQGGSMRGTARILEYLTRKRTKRGHFSDWTWKELTDKVKYSPFPIVTSLLKLDSEYLNRLAVDSFTAIMRYMGDLPLGLHQREVECVYTILVICHHHPGLRDELYCQLMKQTTNNKSLHQESSIRGWRLLAFVAAFFRCSDSLMPYLMKYLDTAAQDIRRVEQETAQICMANLKQTFKYGGRRNVPSEEEVHYITEGKLSRQHTYFLPGGIKISLPTSASTVVEDITKCIGHKMGIEDEAELREFSLYCIVEGDQYTMPLEKDEYIHDLVAELEKNENIYYLVFCRSVWNFPLRLDSELYIDIIFHQIVPDYLEGYLLVLPSHHLKMSRETQEELLRIASLLYRANGNNNTPNETDILSLLPKTVLHTYNENIQFCSAYISKLWGDMIPLNTTEAKAQCLEILQKWPLFGSCFFGIKMLEDSIEEESILAINKMGANVLDIRSHETLWRFSFSAVHAPCNGVELQGTTYADVVFGDETIQKTIRLQVDHAHEVTRLIKQYEAIQMQSETKHGSMDYPTVMIKI
ncbi:unconventional myosin-XV [Caerostris darwini]|uniref:Unconventional myosin-XV n=1 Tax=Caerostris darwini TaxID=1538125 RepID=A0AAV4WCM9_9ARAC|nr:unconventional myosin-XV [Caerostris darwini]